MTVRDPSGLATDVVVMPLFGSIELADAGDLPIVSDDRMSPSLSVFVTVLEPSGFLTDIVVMPLFGSVELANVGDFPTISFDSRLPSLSVLVTVRVPSGFWTEVIVTPLLSLAPSSTTISSLPKTASLAPV